MCPAVRRPDGGRAKGVSLRMMAKTKASTRPSTKTGRRDAEVGQGHGADVDEAVAADGRDDAEGDAHDGRQEQGQDAQLDGQRQALEEQLGDGPAVLGRIAQFAARELAEVDGELLGDRVGPDRARSLNRAQVSASARSPRAATHGSPGSSRARANTRNRMPNRTGRATRMRRPMKRIIAATHSCAGCWGQAAVAGLPAGPDGHRAGRPRRGRPARAMALGQEAGGGGLRNPANR